MAIGCYIPPNYPMGRGRGALEFIAGTVSEAKRRFDDPLIVVAGDYNQWDVAGALSDFQDLKEAPVGNTRGDRSIDRIFTNVDHEEAGTLPPLETDPGEDEGEGTPKKSDHDIAFCKMKLPRTESFEMLTYSYRYYNPDSEEKFGSWLASMDWSELEAAGTSNEKTEIYQMEVTRAQDRLFPLITVRRQSNDPPWYNRNIKRLSLIHI